ncbi:MAG: multiprotein bridging factor aMBF1 [Candidatus Woesearchaeota archaeon]
MQCNLCGKQAELFLVDIEGSELEVCKSCSSHGKIIKRVKTVEQVKKEEKSEKEFIKKIIRGPEKEIIQMIAEGYSQRIKNAREKLNLKQEDFALKINEKQNLIHNIETGRMEPSIPLARKLEKFLNIILVEQEEVRREYTKPSKSDSLTVGDLITIRKRK